MKIVNFTKRFFISALILAGIFSCETQQGTTSSNSVGLNAVKQLLTSSTNQGFSILGDTDSFLTNALIEAVLPEKLKEINTKLENLGLSSLVEKEKQYIGKAAATSVDIAKPIVTSAIQEITLADAIGIISGGKGAATEYLKSKTERKLIEAIQPEVDDYLNSNGITSLINNATQDNSIKSAFATILGKNTTTTNVGNSISEYASQQIVDGLFAVAKDYEVKNYNLSGVLNSVLGGGN